MANCVQCGRKLPPLTFGKKICQWCVQHEAAQQGETDDDVQQHVMPAPWVRRSESTITLTHLLFGANVAVFLAMLAASANPAAFLEPTHEFSPQVSIHFGANYGPYTLSGQWWRLVTYMFLHGGVLHIGFNMWCLWDLGALCESLYGRWTYAAIYLITGVAAGLTSVAWNPAVWSVGASGAIFGLAGALIASFYLGEFSLTSVAIRGTLRSLIIFAVFNLFFGQLFPGIDNACHIGGLVSGLILGALIARLAPQQDHLFRRVGVLLFVALLTAGSAWGVQRWRGSSTQSAINIERSISRTITALQTKVEKNPQDASAHYALAHAYLIHGEWSQAEAELNHVLDLQPQNVDARMDLGATYLNHEQAREAQEQFAKLVAQDPNDSEAHVGLGMALAGQHNYTPAVEEYKTALRLDPQSKGVYFQLGISQAQLKQYDDAIASYLKERDQSGDDPSLEMALAEAYQAKGLEQKAQEAKGKATQMKNAAQQ
jgi:rhomboid protease GluP